MRWKSRKVIKREDKNAWRRWFAWYPVRTKNGNWVWLEAVEMTHWLNRSVSADEYKMGSGAFVVYREIDHAPVAITEGKRDR